MTEQQVKEEVLRYLSDESYNYAILIDGEWGCGKTFFVKNDLTKAIEEQENATKPRHVKYISLYGCKSIADIQENVAWSFAEDAREKICGKAEVDGPVAKVTGNMFLTGRKIGNIILKKIAPETSLSSIALDWLNMSSHIMIFDDLERCDCPINEVFGFLNELVEHENTKVILVANEKEISGIAEPKYLEQQYQLAIEDRIQWPKQEKNGKWDNDYSNSGKVSFPELERRRALLFPAQDANLKYKKIREKLIGVTLRYTPNVFEIMSEIISSAKFKEEYKTLLLKQSEEFKSTMGFYHHHNLRTFQFFLSKVIYLLEKLESISLQDEYISQIQSRIIKDTFSIAVKLKANYKPPRNNSFWLGAEQNTGLPVIKKYVESGEFLIEEFQQEVLTLQTELQASVPDDDPFFLLTQQYFFHPQVWCEDQLDRMIGQLRDNKYPLSLYSRIIIVIQRLLDLGFNPDDMEIAKECMLQNIDSMGEVQPIVVQFWDDGDSEFKERVQDQVTEINRFISTRSTEAGCKSVTGILNETDWIEGLLRYIRPQNDWYVDDIPVFSKADSDLWLKRICEASPQGIYDFQHWLSLLYPEDMVRESYERDAPIIKKILIGLKEFEEADLIKKARVKWLEDQFNRIIEINEPAVTESLEDR